MNGNRLRVIVFLAAALTAAWAVRAQQDGDTYTPEEVSQTEASVFFDRLATPEEGRRAFAAMWALTQKGLAADPEGRAAIIGQASRIIGDPAAPPVQRWKCCYVLSGIGDPAGIPALTGALSGDADATVRSVAACALGAFVAEEPAQAALKTAAEAEADAEVKKWIARALAGEFRAARGGGGGVDVAAPKVNDVDLGAVLRGEAVALVLVKDFLRIDNSGGALESVEFDRYLPAIDEEQVVLGRWIDARVDADGGGGAFDASISAVDVDPGGNLVQTVRLAEFPAGSQVVVTLTSLVVRRERALPAGPAPIVEAEQLPEEARRYLANTPMVVREHDDVKALAARLLAQTTDVLEFARLLAAEMKAKAYTPEEGADHSLPTSVFTLRHGASCCASAVAAAAVMRSAGIPARVTYCPAGYIHGILRFHVPGHGWVRMDSTCGTGKFPLVQSVDDLGLVRLYDTPIEMESLTYAYAWPYHHNDLAEPYRFRAGGQAVQTLRFASKDEGAEVRVHGWVTEPFPHLEPGSWNAVLGAEPAAALGEWEALVRAAREAALTGRTGPFAAGDAPALRAYFEAAETWGRAAED